MSVAAHEFQVTVSIWLGDIPEIDNADESTDSKDRLACTKHV